MATATTTATTSQAPSEPASRPPIWTQIDCDHCHCPFVDADDWDARHTPDNNPLADVHARCCTDCDASCCADAPESI